MKKIPVAPAPVKTDRRKLSPLSRGMLIGMSSIALILVLLTFMDGIGFHMIYPEVVPLGCLLVLLLALIWGCIVLYRKIKTDSRKKLFVVVALLIIMIISVGLSNSILQVTAIAMPHKYSTLKSPDGKPVVIMYAVDTGIDDMDAMLARMDARSAYYDTINGAETPADAEPIAAEFTSILERYDSEDFGYVYFPFPRLMGIFYTTNCEMNGEVYRGSESTAKLLYEWQDNLSLRLYLENPLPGDEGEAIVTLAE